MGKGKYLLPRMLVLISIFIVVLFSQGCDSQGETVIDPETEVPEVTELPSPAPTEEEVEEEVMAPDWCDSEGDLYDMLPQVDPNAEGITVEICILGGEDYTIETYEEIEPIPENLADTKGLDRTFDIYALLAYFKVKDGEVVITSFDSSLLMRITYTSDAWQQILERGFDEPRVAYLEWGEDDWVEPWIEFTDEIYQITPPDLEDPDSEGYLEIIIDELPDPLIGDC